MDRTGSKRGSSFKYDDPSLCKKDQRTFLGKISLYCPLNGDSEMQRDVSSQAGSTLGIQFLIICSFRSPFIKKQKNISLTWIF